jgi:predicted dehydrogenase
VITLGLIGAGRWGRRIARTLESVPGCRLKYIAARSTRTLNDLPGAYVKTTRWTDFLTRDDLDGVIIATPGSTHAEIARELVRLHLPTFIEKPLATTLRDARAIERAAVKARTLVFVGHVHLYNPAYLKTKELTQRAGKVRFIMSEGMNHGPVREDMSVLWDWAPHDLSMTLDLLGTTPVAVQAWGQRTLRPRTRLDDVVQLRLRFRGGEEVFSMFSWLSPEKRRRFTVVGERDAILFDDTAQRKITLYKNVGPLRRGDTVVRQPTVTHPHYSALSPLQCELRAFVASIRTGVVSPRSNVHFGVATVRIMDAAERSIARGGRWISL